MVTARQNGWTKSESLAEELSSLIEVSLYSSHMQRIDRNPVYNFDNTADSIIIRAKNGIATPVELLSILIDYPELRSIEIAKLSYPLDGYATQVMDNDVCGVLVELCGGLRMEEPRYKTKTIQTALPAATILRKQAVANYDTPDGMVQVVQRKAFLVRGDDEARRDNDYYLDRIVKNPQRNQGELYEKIENRILYANDPDLKWLQPLATSYYAKYLPTDLTTA